MKEKIIASVIVTVLVLAVIFTIMYAMRFFSMATTPVTVVRPEEGIVCVHMVTSDGASISCLKE